MIFLDANGNLLDECLSDNKNEYKDISKIAHQYLSKEVILLQDVSLRSVLTLINNCPVLKNLFSYLNIDKAIDYIKTHKEKESSVFNEIDIQRVRIYRSAEFNHYANTLSVSSSHYLIAEVIGSDGIAGFFAADFIPMKHLLDVPIYLDGVIVSDAENLLNSPAEQEELQVNMPVFNLFEVLDALFNEISLNSETPNVDLDDVNMILSTESVEKDISEIFPNNSDVDFTWFSDGPRLGIEFTPKFKGVAEEVYYLIDLLPNCVDMNLFLNKYFPEQVILKEPYKNLNAYEFRCKAYGEPKSMIPTQKFMKSILAGKAIRKHSFVFSSELKELWEDMGLNHDVKTLKECVKK